MPPLSEYRAAWVASLLFTQTVTATPQVAFPINSQVPPVAYVSQPFEFTFSLDTFTGISPETSYSLLNQPQWLSIDATARKLQGTPTLTDVGAPNFRLVASDADGRATSDVTLVILQEQTLSPGDSIIEDLMSFGNVSAPSTLLLYPAEAFAFSISPSVFNGVSEKTIFYTVSPGRSPLPSWIQFDSERLSFSGTTPVLVSPEPSSQIYEFDVIASDVLGFSETGATFQISIGHHVLAFEHPIVNVTTSSGEELQIPSLLDDIVLDGVKISRDKIASLSTDAPAWLDFDHVSLSFNGTVPRNVTNATFSISATSLGANTANATISLHVSSLSVMNHTGLGIVSAVAGTYFTYTIALPRGFDEHTTISADIGASLDWLFFIPVNRTLHGTVPADADAQTRYVSLAFQDSGATTIVNLTLSIIPSPFAPTETASVPRTSDAPTATPPNTTPPANTSPSNQKKNLAILILTIVLPIIAVLSLICIVCVWLRKRSKQPQPQLDESELASQASVQPAQSVIDDENGFATVTESVRSETREHRNSYNAPQVELPWAPDSIDRTRKRLSKKPRASRSSVIGPSWDDLINFQQERQNDSFPALPPVVRTEESNRANAPILRQQVFQEIPSQKQEAANTNSQNQWQALRVSRLMSLQPTAVLGLPQRRSGIGHGAGDNRPSETSDPRSSWQTTLGTIPMVDSRPSTIMLDSFPAPPHDNSDDGRAARDKTATSRKGQSRWRFSNSDSSRSDSPGDGRQNYYTQKARDQLQGGVRSSKSKPGPSLRVVPNTRSDEPLSEDAASLSDLDSVKLNPVYPAVAKTHESHVAQERTAHADTRPPLQRSSMINRDTSMASSRQFDSAMSSDSQWDVGNLVADENVVGKIYWQPKKSSPRLPFEPYHEAQGQGPESSEVSESHQPRLVDQRRHVSIETTNLDYPSRSYKGSLRFV